LIGHIGFSPLDGEVEIGFSVAHEYQRQGFASEAIVAASRWALQAFALDRIRGITSVANVASRRALMRARFAYEGDRIMCFQGAEQAVCVYALSGNSVPASGNI
jgi:RimJ/RimL family protein N-acetyltransferase